MQSNNLTPPSSTSSSSSLSSLCSTGSITTNNNSKKCNYNSNNNNNERHLPNSKRKLLNGYNHSNNFNNELQSVTKPANKPFYSEYLNSKSVLYVYFKGDVLNAIDDHFKKSFNLNKSTSNYNKKESPTATNTSTAASVYSNDYYWSTTTNSNNSVPILNKTSASALTNYLTTPNFTNEYNNPTSTSNEMWPYYQQAQYYDNNGTYQNNATINNNNNNVYENCWNRSVSAATNGFYNYNSYYDQQQHNHQSKSITNNKSFKEVCIKEEPLQINHSFETNQMSSYSNFDINGNYNNPSNNNNRYSTQYFDISKQNQDLKSNNKINGNYLHYHQGFDLSPNLEANNSLTSVATTASLRDTATYAAVYNY